MPSARIQATSSVSTVKTREYAIEESTFTAYFPYQKSYELIDIFLFSMRSFFPHHTLREKRSHQQPLVSQRFLQSLSLHILL
jgi:hypothetical protein